MATVVFAAYVVGLLGALLTLGPRATAWDAVRCCLPHF
jgi:hypothetical protein